MITNEFQIAVFEGDGIGHEIMKACLSVLEKLEQQSGGFQLIMENLPGGAEFYRETGLDITEEAFEKARQADAILFGAMGLPDVRFPDGTEIAPHLTMRVEFGLFAGVRPVKAYPNVPSPLADPRAADIDLIILRECTEGLFASRGKGEVIDDQEARDTLVITRAASERLFDFAFKLAQRRKEKGGKGMVTCVDQMSSGPMPSSERSLPKGLNGSRISNPPIITSMPWRWTWSADPGISTSWLLRTCLPMFCRILAAELSAAWA